MGVLVKWNDGNNYLGKKWIFGNLIGYNEHNKFFGEKMNATPDGRYKMAQLVRACRSLAEFCEAYGVPCVSGKDSMKNDSTRGGRKISIPPSLLFSVISKMNDITKSVTLDAKCPGDLVYVIGDTRPELGGSEYFSMLGATGNRVPEVDADKFIPMYRQVEKATDKRLFKSLITPSLGGLAVAFAKTALAGNLGLNLDLAKLPVAEDCQAVEKLFSESNGRFVATVSPDKAAEFEALFAGMPCSQIGVVSSEAELVIVDNGETLVNTALNELRKSYKDTLAQV